MDDGKQIGTAASFNLVTEDGDLLIEGVSLAEAHEMAKNWLDVVIIPTGAEFAEILPLAA